MQTKAPPNTTKRKTCAGKDRGLTQSRGRRGRGYELKLYAVPPLPPGRSSHGAAMILDRTPPIVISVMGNYIVSHPGQSAGRILSVRQPIRIIQPFLPEGLLDSQKMTYRILLDNHLLRLQAGRRNLPSPPLPGPNPQTARKNHKPANGM